MIQHGTDNELSAAAQSLRRASSYSITGAVKGLSGWVSYLERVTWLVGEMFILIQSSHVDFILAC